MRGTGLEWRFGRSGSRRSLRRLRWRRRDEQFPSFDSVAAGCPCAAGAGAGEDVCAAGGGWRGGAAVEGLVAGGRGGRDGCGGGREWRGQELAAASAGCSG